MLSSVLWEKGKLQGWVVSTSKTARQGPMPLNEMTIGKMSGEGRRARGPGGRCADLGKRNRDLGALCVSDAVDNPNPPGRYQIVFFLSVVHTIDAGFGAG